MQLLIYIFTDILNFIVCADKRKSVISSVDQTDVSRQFESNGLMSQLLLEVFHRFHFKLKEATIRF